jgi:hypothetical protein
MLIFWSGLSGVAGISFSEMNFYPSPSLHFPSVKCIVYMLLPKSISCFDKLSMSGKVKWFRHITVRPEPVEG